MGARAGIIAAVMALTAPLSGYALAHATAASSAHGRPAAAVQLLSAERRGGNQYRRLAFAWATGKRGCPYVYGGTGPCGDGYDCSGLVQAAYARIGFAIPRTTQEMLASGRLRRVNDPKRGDLSFYGSGHVELYVGGNVTFGALNSSAGIGFHTWNRFWHPTAFLAVIGAGQRS